MSFLEQIIKDKNTRFIIFLFVFFISALIFLSLNDDIQSYEEKKRYRDYKYYY